MTSSLGRGGPSPSELVGASTMWMRHPGGVSRRNRSLPSRVSAQFFDVAAKSTTSRRSAPLPCWSASGDTDHVSAQQQPVDDRLELDRRADETDLEGPIIHVIIDLI